MFGSSHQSSINNRHSSSDWLYNIQSIPQSTILREVRNPVLAVAGWSAMVAVAHRLLIRSSSLALQSMAIHLQVSGAAHSFLVSALGLLLVFRTNSAYQRFQEGRLIWQEILSVARNLSRMSHLYRKEIGHDRLERMLNLLAAYPYLLRHHIRPGCLCEDSNNLSHIPAHCRLALGERPLELETRHEGDQLQRTTTRSSPRTQSRLQCWVDRRNLPWRLFDARSLPKLARSHNRPLWACDRLGREIMEIPYGPNFTSRERLVLLNHAEKLTNAVGQCERIHQTAVPLNYARHSLRSLTIWLFTLPFCLVKDMGLLTPLVAAVSAWTLFGIYQIGYTIEDPFQGSLRLSILCDSIRRDVLGDSQQLGSSNHDDDDRESAYQLDTETKERSFPVAKIEPHVQAMFSNGTLVDSFEQEDLGTLVNPPAFLVGGPAVVRSGSRSIEVQSRP